MENGARRHRNGMLAVLCSHNFIKIPSRQKEMPKRKQTKRSLFFWGDSRLVFSTTKETEWSISRDTDLLYFKYRQDRGHRKQKSFPSRLRAR